MMGMAVMYTLEMRYILLLEDRHCTSSIIFVPVLIFVVCSSSWSRDTGILRVVGQLFYPFRPLWRNLGKLVAAVFKAPAAPARRAANRRRQAAVGYLATLPPESKRRWRGLGWLVMLRARHQIFLAQTHRNSRCWLCRPQLRGRHGITRQRMADPLGTAGGESSAGTPGDDDIEMCDDGNSNQEFAQAAVSVVGSSLSYCCVLPIHPTEGRSDYSGEDDGSMEDIGLPSLWAYCAYAYVLCWIMGMAMVYTLEMRYILLLEDCHCTARITFVPVLVFVVVPVVGVVIPAFWVVWQLYYRFRPLWRGLGRLVIAVFKAPAAWATRRRQAAVCYLSAFSPESKRRWRGLGWLVMLRARHQKFLAQTHQSSRCRLCRSKLRGRHGITRPRMADPLALAGGEPPAGTPGVAGVEVCEEGNSYQQFAQAVVSVVGIREEGLFRDIVLYL